MERIEKYNKALQDIYDHVGFVEDWVVCPLDDCTNYYWDVDIEKNRVKYATTKENFRSTTGDYYIEGIYTQRFYKKWVYAGEIFTLVFCDSQTDGMKYFRLFDNKKKMS